MFKKIINLGAVYYTAITAVMLIISLIFGGEGSALSLGAWNFLTILFFSFCMSLGTALRDGKTMSRTAGIVTHAVCYVGGFFVFVMLCNKAGFTMTVIGTAIFAVCYAAACIAKSLMCKKAPTKKPAKAKREKSPVEQKRNAKAESKKKKDAEYKPMFSDGGEDEKT